MNRERRVKTLLRPTSRGGTSHLDAARPAVTHIIILHLQASLLSGCTSPPRHLLP